jgi:hypothetical protein
MKNIHILPTDKPSRLAKHSSGSFHIVANKSHKKGLYNMTNQNIYITSDEEITGKIGFNIKENKIQFFNSHPKYDESGKKIILTTDPQLIADGVQAIDDEFLEWFIKNPSCEFVEVVKYHGINTSIAEISAVSGNDDYNWKGRGDFRDYKITIPKEEPKPLPDVNWQSEIINKVWDEEVEESFATQLFSDNSKIIPDYFQPKSHLENLLEQLDNLESTVDEFVENSSEERLKDAAKIAIPELSHIISDLSKVREIYITGIKSNAARDYWYEKFQEQDNNKFSEEDMMEAVRFGMLYKSDSSKKLFEKKGMVPTEVLKKWFEKFKKK